MESGKSLFHLYLASVKAGIHLYPSPSPIDKALRLLNDQMLDVVIEKRTLREWQEDMTVSTNKLTNLLSDLEFGGSGFFAHIEINRRHHNDDALPRVTLTRHPDGSTEDACWWEKTSRMAIALVLRSRGSPAITALRAREQGKYVRDRVARLTALLLGTCGESPEGTAVLVHEYLMECLIAAQTQLDDVLGDVEELPNVQESFEMRAKQVAELEKKLHAIDATGVKKMQYDVEYAQAKAEGWKKRALVAEAELARLKEEAVAMKKR